MKAYYTAIQGNISSIQISTDSVRKSASFLMSDLLDHAGTYWNLWDPNGSYVIVGDYAGPCRTMLDNVGPCGTIRVQILLCVHS